MSVCASIKFILGIDVIAHQHRTEMIIDLIERKLHDIIFLGIIKLSEYLLIYWAYIF